MACLYVDIFKFHRQIDGICRCDLHKEINFKGDEMKIYVALDVPEDFENCLSIKQLMLIQHEIINDRWSWNKDTDVLRQIGDKLDELNKAG